MKSRRIAYAALAVVGALALGTLTACSDDKPAASATTPAGATADTNKPVSITVAVDQGLSDDAKKQFADRITAFEAKYPNITVKSQEYNWTAQTFAAQLAGGTLPAVFTVPFTDGRGLIANGQIANLSALVKQLPYADKFNPNVAAEAEDADGNMWAVPIAAYGQGLHYNRKLFTAAGLDPDKPPTTWAEVESDAKAIASKTKAAGFATMTKDNTGGWILTTMDYALGGRVEDESGKATVDTPEMKAALEYYKKLRWDDDAMGANFLYDWNGINQDFAAGKIGMYVSGGGNLPNLITQNNMNTADYGVTVLPLEGSDAGALGGGTLAVVSPKVDADQQAAAVKWIDFFYIGPLTDEDAAVASAKQSVANNQPVGSPALPIFDEATYAQQQEWIKPYVNVPLDQMTGYTDNVGKQPLLPEPGVATQDVYKALDPVVQTVLTQKNADIDKLLASAQTAAQAAIDKASK